MEHITLKDLAYCKDMAEQIKLCKKLNPEFNKEQIIEKIGQDIDLSYEKTEEFLTNCLYMSHPKTVLHCYSSGDKRFSALCVQLKSGHTIEFLYQSAKLNEDQLPFENGKGIAPAYLKINGEIVPSTPELRHMYYAMLWHVHFLEHPEKLEEAKQYKFFVDKYDKHGGELIQPKESYLTYANNPKNGCNQAAAIALLVKLDNKFPFERYPLLQSSFEKYWAKYHTKEETSSLPSL